MIERLPQRLTQARARVLLACVAVLLVLAGAVLVAGAARAATVVGVIDPAPLAAPGAAALPVRAYVPGPFAAASASCNAPHGLA